MNNLDFEGREYQETQLLLESFWFSQKTSLKDVPSIAPQFSSLGGGEIAIRDIESNHRNFVESLARDNLRAYLIKGIGTVIEEVPRKIEKRCFAFSRDEEKCFRNENKVSKKSNGSICPASVNFGPWITKKYDLRNF